MKLHPHQFAPEATSRVTVVLRGVRQTHALPRGSASDHDLVRVFSSHTFESNPCHKSLGAISDRPRAIHEVLSN